MYQLQFIKCDEVLIEDLGQDDVYECFYPYEEGSVKVVFDGEELFTLDLEEVEYVPETTKLEIPEGYYGHSIGWRVTEFDVVLNDPNHKLTKDDFTWTWYTIDEYEWQVPALKEEVGTLEFNTSWDGRYDEVLDVEGRPGPEEEEW